MSDPESRNVQYFGSVLQASQSFLQTSPSKGDPTIADCCQGNVQTQLNGGGSPADARTTMDPPWVEHPSHGGNLKEMLA